MINDRGFDSVHHHGMMGQFVVNSTTVGLDEMFAEEISIYPNPSHGAIRIKSPERVKEIAIYDVAGNRVHVEKPETAEILLNLSLPAGTYFIEGQNLNRTWVKNWVVE